MTTLVFDAPPRNVPLDIDYFIDCAIECHDITLDIAFWMQHFCPNLGDLLMFEPFPRGGRDPEDGYINEGEAIIRLHAAYQDWFNSDQTEPLQKLLCCAVGMSGIPHLLTEISRYVPQDVIIEDDSDTCPELGRLKALTRPKNFNKNHKPIRVIPARKATRYGGNGEITIYEWREFVDIGYPARCAKLIRAIAERFFSLGMDLPDNIRIDIPRADPTKYVYRRHYAKDEKRIIRRGIKLLTDLIGYNATREFMSSREILIPGEKFDLKLNLEHLGESHGGARTRVLVKGEPICNLCIYTPETPILDHVASMIVHMRAGMEDDIFLTGNPYEIMVKEPTGIAVIDENINTDRLVRERIVVDRVIMPEVEPASFIRLGDAPIVHRFRRQMSRDIAAYLEETVIAPLGLPKPKVLFNYETEHGPWERETMFGHTDRLVMAICEDDIPQQVRARPIPPQLAVDLMHEADRANRLSHVISRVQIPELVPEVVQL